MKWTRKQREVIEARNCDLLVSAAAGSGKTAVLVERIIELICDEAHPVDIDRLLVMTFTNAAAAEMRERIAMAIEKKLEEEPWREHLQVQTAVVHRAQITTIDSFCLSLIRDHFNLLDIDPGFRIGDEGELMLVRADVMEAMLEEYYETGDRVFQEFVETYASGKSDSGIENYIMQVYTFSQSNPFPMEWIAGCRQELERAEEESLETWDWMKYLMKDVKLQLEEAEELLESALEVCGQEGGHGPAAEGGKGLQRSEPGAPGSVLRQDRRRQRKGHRSGEKRVRRCLQESGQEGSGRSERALRAADQRGGGRQYPGQQGSGAKASGTGRRILQKVSGEQKREEYCGL